jgi:hypothetical protein
LNLVILPIYSWRGAAWTSLACDGLLLAVFWCANVYYCRRPQCAAAAPQKGAGFAP